LSDGLLLDSCALLDLAQQQREALVSVVAGLEIAQKVWAGNLVLGSAPDAWFKRTLAELELRELPLELSVALAAYALPEPFHRDPADRLMVATARALQIPLLTSDRLILAYADAGHVAAVAY
jgi:PIN domain nuclease of toxin-antitoxin system